MNSWNNGMVVNHKLWFVKLSTRFSRVLFPLDYDGEKQNI